MLSAEAWCELARAALVVRRAELHPRLLADALRLRPGRGVGGEVVALVGAVGWAVRFHVRPMSCLERALATLWILRRRRFGVALRIGCRGVGGSPEFHAWVVDEGGAVVAGSGEEGTFDSAPRTATQKRPSVRE